MPRILCCYCYENTTTEQPALVSPTPAFRGMEIAKEGNKEMKIFFTYEVHTPFAELILLLYLKYNTSIIREFRAKGNPFTFPLALREKLREIPSQILFGLREFSQTEIVFPWADSPGNDKHTSNNK